MAMSVVVAPAAATNAIIAGGAERGRHDSRRAEIHRFNDHDRERWRAGHWHRGKHAGRIGWWWIAGGAWYYYPAPVYPYPNPYQPPLLPAPAVGQFLVLLRQSPGLLPHGCAVPGRLAASAATVVPGVSP